MQWFVYILKCSDDSFYIGQTSDLEKRIVTHIAGNGPKYTSVRRPVSLVYSESYNSHNEAVKREMQLKKWSRAKKQALIDGDIDHLKKLSKSHSIRINTCKFIHEISILFSYIGLNLPQTNEVPAVGGTSCPEYSGFAPPFDSLCSHCREFVERLMASRNNVKLLISGKADNISNVSRMVA